MATIVLLHGALATEHQVLPLKKLLRDHTVLSLTFSGHGERAKEPLDLQRFVDDIQNTVARYGAEKVHLFGYSMGGYAALLHAARFPDRVLSVTTLGSIFVWTEEGLEKELRKLDPELMLAKVPGFVTQLAQWHGADRWRDVVHGIAVSMKDLAARPLLNDMVLSRIQCPVLMCVGDGDTSAGVDNTRLFSQRLPHAAFLLLQSTRHPFEEVDLHALLPHLNDLWTTAG